ncbi:cobalt-precorrin-6A reductase [Patulibacter sp. NPDC049589]|uniref:cobalt-precorrin-6A reductase n=1 Tax=Patulibacter sp. NPDC049589 TaxID=3154731 RepID=UPI0034207374
MSANDRAAPVLVLGGTSGARELAAILDGDPSVRPITSLAGRVADPGAVAGEVRTGGFGGATELARWIGEHGIAAVVDATHPFAAAISRNAAEACAAAGVPLVALRRPGWTAGPGDDWHDAADLADAAARIAGLGTRVLLAIGRQEAPAFAGVAGAWFLIRAIEAPDGTLPPHHQLLLARGPYALEDERRLLADHAIDLVVTKDSGGDATRGKLDAARERGIPVLVVRRPEAPGGAGITAVATAADAAAAVRAALVR